VDTLIGISQILHQLAGAGSQHVIPFKASSHDIVQGPSLYRSNRVEIH